MSTSSLCSSDEEDEFLTPVKRKYNRCIFHGKRKQMMGLEFLDGATSLVESTHHYLSSDEESIGMPEEDLALDKNSNSEDNQFQPENRNTYDPTSDESDLSISDENSLLLENQSEETDDEEALDFNSDDEQWHSNDVNMHQKTFLYQGSSHTYISSYVSIMLFVMKYSLTKDAFSDLLSLIRTHLPKDTKFTTSVYRLKEVLKKNIGFEEPVKHYYCDTCGVSLEEGSQCSKQNCRGLNSNLLMFHDLRLERQLAELFKDESFCQLTLDRQSQQEHVIDTFKDISDGSEYKRLMNLQKTVPSERNLTFTMNTDGVALFSSSHKGSLWPVYLAINELPVKLRFSKKYIITTHLYCQPDKPSMLTYLSPLMKSLQRLHCEGLRVVTPRGEMLVRFHLLAVTLDLPARAVVLNMKQFNGKFGCCYCEDEGSSPPNCPMHRYYPYNMESVLRQHCTMMNDAQRATVLGNTVRGIKGASPLAALRYIDLPKTVVIDWMHSVLLGVVKTVLALWLDASYKGRLFYIGDKMALINGRLLSIQVPDYITRQQRNIGDYKHWKATECRDWLLHYSLPVISGIQNMDISVHYALLVTALYLLNQVSVTGKDVDTAEHYLKDFCQLFPSFYDPEKQTMNIHLLKHLPQFVRLHGPLFNYSCFGFESMNNHLKSMVHGTRFVNNQICFAVGMTKCLPDLVKSIMVDANSDVKSLIQHLSKHLTCDDVKEDFVRICPLGKKKPHILTDHERNLFRNQPQLVSKCQRVQTNIGVIYCEEYKRTRSRNSYSVAYKNAGNTYSFGSVKYFIKTEENIFAVVRKFLTTENSLLDFNLVQERVLKKYKDSNLCLQYQQLSQRHRETIELVNVENITSKCVYIECQKGKKFVSVPSNVLEHS